MKKLLILLVTALLSFNCYSNQVITMCDENQTTFTYSTSSGEPGVYTWTVDGIAQTSVSANLTVDWNGYPFGTHIIEVSFTSVGGCSTPITSYEVTTVECDNSTLYAPNAFTPDGDSYNNVWIPVGYNYKEIHFMIYNRWGQRIFESYNGNFGWDGTYAGSPCQEDVYVYVINWTDNQNKVHLNYGHITLLR